jgi:hypothetical protein
MLPRVLADLATPLFRRLLERLRGGRPALDGGASEQARGEIVASRGQRHVDLERRSSVELARPTRARPGASRESPERHIEQPRVREFVEMKRRQRSRNAQGTRRFVAAHLDAPAQDVEVERPADGVGERGKVVELTL